MMLKKFGSCSDLSMYPFKAFHERTVVCVAAVVPRFNAYVSFSCFLPLFAVLTAVRDNFVLEGAVSCTRCFLPT